MKVITDEALLDQVAGGIEPAGDSSGNNADAFPTKTEESMDAGGGFVNVSDNDQRNQAQKDADARLKQYQRACNLMGNPIGCSELGAAENYRIQMEEYASCKAQNIKDGPDGCGQMPKLPKKK